ncbi:hypothetical protein TRVL_01642 [Trypanosoma vivax]|nr:hypothetical protein TRVL_01642 [Trypanosoma vivax]
MESANPEIESKTSSYIHTYTCECVCVCFLVMHDRKSSASLPPLPRHSDNTRGHLTTPCTGEMCVRIVFHIFVGVINFNKTAMKSFCADNTVTAMHHPYPAWG